MAATIINNPPGIIDGPARIYASNVYTLHVDTDRSTIVSKAIISPSPGRAPFEPFHRRPTTFLLVHRGRITKPYLSIRDAFFFPPPPPLLSRHVIIGYGSEISIGNIFAGLFFFFFPFLYESSVRYSTMVNFLGKIREKLKSSRIGEAKDNEHFTINWTKIGRKSGRSNESRARSEKSKSSNAGIRV